MTWIADGESGASVRGKLNALAPTFTADTDIAAGTGVSLKANGHAQQTWGPAPNVAGVVGLFAGVVATPAVLALSGGGKLVAFVPSVGAQGCVVSGNAIPTVGAVETGAISKAIAASAYGPNGAFVTACALTASTFAALYNDSGTGNVNLVIGSVASDGAVTYGTPVQLYAQGGLSQSGTILTALTATLVLTNVCLLDGSQSALAASVAGIVITAGSAVQVTSVSDSGYAATERLSATAALLAYNDGNSGGDTIAVVATVSGTTITLHTPATVPGWAGIAILYAAVLSATSFVILVKITTVRAVAAGISGTDITFGTPLVLGANSGGPVPWLQAMGSSKVAVQGVTLSVPLILSVSGLALTKTAAAGVGPGNLYAIKSNAYITLYGPLAVLSATLLVFCDANYAIYLQDDTGAVSPAFAHDFLTGYWLYPLTSTTALATLLDINGVPYARVITCTAMAKSPPVGISAAGASSGNPVIAQSAGVVAGLSGLTPGVTYYYSGDGSLVSVNSGHHAGVAISATQLLLA